MNISMIAAIGKNNEIGKNNKLIWPIKEDLKYFKDTTTGHTIIMGKNTFLSLPKLLPNRHHIVFTHNGYFGEEVEVYDDIKKFLENYKNCEDEMFVIGGAKIYSEFLKYADKLYLTEINEEDKEADAFFPIFDKSLYDQQIQGFMCNEKISYCRKLYRRK